MLNDKIHQLKEKEIEQKDLMLKSMKLVRLRLRPINDRYSIQPSKRVSIPKTINQKDIKKKTSRLELNVLSTTCTSFDSTLKSANDADIFGCKSTKLIDSIAVTPKVNLRRLCSKNENEIDDLRRISVQRKIDDKCCLKIPEFTNPQQRRCSAKSGAVCFKINSHRSSCQSSDLNNSQNMQMRSPSKSSRKEICKQSIQKLIAFQIKEDENRSKLELARISSVTEDSLSRPKNLKTLKVENKGLCSLALKKRVGTYFTNALCGVN